MAAARISTALYLLCMHAAADISPPLAANFLADAAAISILGIHRPHPRIWHLPRLAVPRSRDVAQIAAMKGMEPNLPKLSIPARALSVSCALPPLAVAPLRCRAAATPSETSGSPLVNCFKTKA